MDIGVFDQVRLRLRSFARLTHRRRPAIRWNTHPLSMDPLFRPTRMVQGRQLWSTGGSFHGSPPRGGR